MEKKLIQELKERLEKKKIEIEKELEKFAKRDEKLKGDWDTRFPKFNGGRLEEAADEVEEYESRLPIEHTLELKLKDVNSALEKIKKGIYGRCEKCGKEIPEERLKVYSEARFCLNCKQ